MLVNPDVPTTSEEDIVQNEGVQATDDSEVVFVPPVINDISELKPLATEFARADRGWRGLLLILARRTARVRDLLNARIEAAVNKRNATGQELAQTALANRAAIAGERASIVIGDVTITYYDGERGEFKILNSEHLAHLLIANSLDALVSVEARVVYAMDSATVKNALKANPDLLKVAVDSGAASYRENKTVTIAVTRTSAETERGVKPTPFVYQISEED